MVLVQKISFDWITFTSQRDVLSEMVAPRLLRYLFHLLLCKREIESVCVCVCVGKTQSVCVCVSERKRVSAVPNKSNPLCIIFITFILLRFVVPRYSRLWNNCHRPAQLKIDFSEKKYLVNLLLRFRLYFVNELILFILNCISEVQKILRLRYHQNKSKTWKSWSFNHLINFLSNLN